MQIHPPKTPDHTPIQKLYSQAFPKSEQATVSKVATDLLTENTTPETISLIAEVNNTVVGHVAFSPVKIDNDDSLQGYILAPLAIMPDYQKQKIGTRLVEQGIQTLVDMQVNILFVYGDPEYYGRFGFNTDDAEKFIPPHKLQYPFGWQAIIINEFSIKDADSKLVCVASLNDPKLW